jgi:tetratricopeptide (TPR) repeat protein
MTTPAAVLPPSSRSGSHFDSVLAGLVLVLAFLLASFVARNSDVWQHLTVGRLVAAGRYDFVTDPLSYATEGVRWVNHAWVTDWMSYQLFRGVGGAGLVASKAALVALAVGVGLFNLRRDRPRWLAIGFVVLAVVALSPRATLQPMVVSCLLLAVLLHLLQLGGKAYRIVPLLVAVWVNLDDWYVLGPAVTTLHWVGSRIRRSDAVPTWLPLATFAACLVSPFHVHGLTLPTELSPTFWSSELARDPRVAVQFASYFAANPLASEYADNAAFWAYCGLIVGGTVALIVNGRRADPGESLTWVVVVVLSVWQARLVPLCAIVAVSVIARHVQSLTPVSSWGRIGRGATCVAVVGCGVVAWGGWLHGARGRDRIVGWAVYADPSLVEAAATLSTWRTDGLLPTDLRVLGTTPDASNTLAWFAGGERGYLDTRWELHARAGRANSLGIADQLGLATSTPVAGADLDRIKSYRVAAVLLYDPSPRTLASVLTTDGPWRLLRIDGRVVWLAAKPGRADAPVENWPAAAQLTFDADRLAFGGDDVHHPRPTRFAEYRTWWLPSSAQRLDASPVASPAPTDLSLHLAVRSGSPALPLLAVRAARRAIAANPDDAPAWLDLARAYSVLGATVENGVAGGSGLLLEMRRVQRATALTQAVTANPESESAHDGLATTLTEVGYLDRALAERRQQAVLIRRRGDAERLTLLTAVVAKLEDDVFDRECSFQVQTSKMSGDPLGRASIALSLGLAGTAQDILLKSSPDLYGPEGVRVLAGLLLSTGQAREAQALLTRAELVQNPGRLGVLEIPSQTVDGQRIVYRLPAHDWFQFLLAAATGVTDARIPLDRLQQMVTGEIDGVGGFLKQVSVPLTTQVMADVGLGSTGVILPRVAIVLQRDQLLRPVLQTRFLAVERADLAVLEGWCALEDGRRTAAVQKFDSALADYAGATDLRVAPLKGLAELYRKSSVEAVR